jgi:hypothetical protein
VAKFSFRRRTRDPKYGVAKGVAVYTEKGSGVERDWDGPLGEEERLRQWSLDHGVELDGHAASLAVLDSRLDEWNADPSHHGKVDLGNEVGLYLGNVMLSDVAGAHWTIWPNGHPVIALASGRELDVVALANERLIHSGTSLPALFEQARHT